MTPDHMRDGEVTNGDEARPHVTAGGLHVETAVLHGGFRRDPTTRAIVPPIYQSVAYEFDDTTHAADLFALRAEGHTYTRISNPTCEILEQRMTAVEGGAAALSASSGMAAVMLAVMNLASAGDNVVSGRYLFGGTWTLFNNSLRHMGVDVRLVDPDDPEAFREATDARTRCYFGETLPNPRLAVFPIREVADVAAEVGVPLIVDNSAAPVICRPLEHGASMTVYSATKFLAGHGTSLGGVVVDAGTFDWAAHAERFGRFTRPDTDIGGVVWAEASERGDAAKTPYILRLRQTLARDVGATLSPFNAFLVLQGLQTLPMRMRAHCANATAVAEMLSGHAAVQEVTYPGLFEGEARRRADLYLSGMHGALIQFELRGGLERARRFIDSLRLVYHLANIGDARSLAIHPASTTHGQLTPADQRAAGVTEGGIRLSIGIEHVDDILADLDQALEAAST